MVALYSNLLHPHKSLRELKRLLVKLENNETQRQKRADNTPARLIRRRLGKAGVERVVSAYRDGDSIRELAQANNTSHEAMWSLLKEEGVPMRYQSLQPHQIARVVELYEAGNSIYDVADKLGIPKTTVGRTLKKAGVSMRPRGLAGRP